MKIAIIGYGYVGKAIASIFQRTDLIDPVQIELVDPVLSEFSIEQLDDPQFVFVCVGTPSTDTGACDYSGVLDSVQRISQAFPEAICVVKSTVTPDGVDQLLEANPSLVYNPEFLTAANSIEDIRNSTFSIIGCDHLLRKYELIHLYQNFSSINRKCQYRIVGARAAAFAKYAINSFLAIKVAYMNELYEVVGDHEIWQEVVSATQMDPRIGTSHMQVPGPDGEFGFGGACFPKDTNALVAYAESVQLDMHILSTTIAENKRRRNGQ